ncbi:bifunctional riboflavin kinase/FAD synthetase [Reichenbachiella carrageenanivorans]|uniref:Riboflavin biosynthesis protein n=1 Tax=Reichenbachiella carrageenanivorans TaxID=2979869 RepID=A0ABY6D1R9_9BACT|nr:bifunctional riboflavin kinase/FAD synthetase [Reichenbachiella carrageenanivorans]UXX80091.1 bifunctional riboflavin kinase/FAD synthetase [Reichenbachiella carrageenanivorans]
MVIIEGHQAIPDLSNAVVTSGTFDGVHFGHQKILKKIVKTAQELNGKSVVLTFWPHPRFVLFPEEKTLKLLTTFEEKAKLLEEVGIDYLVKVEFTKAFSQLSSETFIQEMLVEQLKTKKLIIGYDHRFGKNRTGSFEYLKENSGRFGFEVEEIPRQDIDDVGVSSTKIRQALFHGEVDLAAEYLGRKYSISGTVVKGKKIGTELGFPTANIQVAEDFKLIPKDGAYAVSVMVNDRWHKGMLNVGVRPTVGGLHRVIETHLFDFDQQIYDQPIQVEFIQHLRNEKKFDSLEELKFQLEKDKTTALSLLKEY